MIWRYANRPDPAFLGLADAPVILSKSPLFKHPAIPGGSLQLWKNREGEKKKKRAKDSRSLRGPDPAPTFLVALHPQDSKLP